MVSNEQLKRHASLVDRMALARGLDLEESALRGDISPEGISDAVLNCSGCSNPDACQHWLDTKQSNQSDAPDYCRNAKLFDELGKS